MGFAAAKSSHGLSIVFAMAAVLFLVSACGAHDPTASPGQLSADSPTPTTHAPDVTPTQSTAPVTPPPAVTPVLPLAGPAGRARAASILPTAAPVDQPAWDLRYTVACGLETFRRAARPAWGEESPAVPAPGGGAFAVSRNLDGGAALFIYTAGGREQVRIPAPDAKFPISAPVWSPDGRRLAFSNVFLSQPGGGVVYVVNRDGSGLAALVSYVGYYDGLAWSPDGMYIAFSSGTIVGRGSGMQVTNYKVLRVAADGSGSPEPLADGCIPVASY
jgi:hypothetical protein